MAHATTAPTTAPTVARRRRLPRRARFALPVLALGVAFAGVACAPPGSPGSGFTGDVVGAVNQDRAAAGLAPLTWDRQLGPYAASWANHLAATGTLTHTDLNALIRLPYMTGWRSLGENLLVGPGNLGGAAAEDLWMNSAGHRANILNPSFNYIGVAGVRDSSGRLWVVAEFGAR
jgi:uncharacterized protein YkwD